MFISWHDAPGKVKTEVILNKNTTRAKALANRKTLKYPENVHISPFLHLYRMDVSYPTECNLADSLDLVVFKV